MARDKSTVVEHSNHNPNIEGLIPTTPLEREIDKNVLSFIANNNSTVVECSTHIPKIEGSNPVTVT